MHWNGTGPPQECGVANIFFLTAVHVHSIILSQCSLIRPEKWYHEGRWISIRKIAAVNRDGHIIISLLFQNEVFKALPKVMIDSCVPVGTIFSCFFECIVTMQLWLFKEQSESSCTTYYNYSTITN